ncbi:MAG TPA: hypothetical protein VL401_01430 [Alphaproteobacteria bacterium]|jgi:hypothetical protein|nr:hypothetical protein [Alphaproteobacteria bacterium]
MLETPHVAVGAAIAVAIPNPFIAIPLAFASHFVLDMVPHWNPHSYTEVQKFGKISVNTKIIALVDVGLALTTGFFIASHASSQGHFITILLASFASVLPDVSKAPFFLLGVRKGILKKWVDFERSLQVETGFWPGMIVQIIIILLALYTAKS